jgi:hypothetical protein
MPHAAEEPSDPDTPDPGVPESVTPAGPQPRPTEGAEGGVRELVGPPTAEEFERGVGGDDLSDSDVEGGGSGRKGGLAGRVKRGIVSMAAATYDARADDLQVRAVAAMREALREESERIIEVATDTYDRRADDLEERAVRATRKVLEEEMERFTEVAQSTYDARADDLEDRAVRALRRAMVEETRRIRSTIERSVQAKRREVRLSLLVLVLANLLYLVVYWATTGFE